MKFNSVAVIGSCRVFSPISRVIDNHELRISHGKTEWFTHSTRDIIQKIKILDKKFEINEKLIPLVINDLKKYHPAYHKNGFFNETDCYVIEVCSIQSNNYTGTELQQWCVRDLQNNSDASSEKILSNLIKSHLTKEEILIDLETIHSYLDHKPMLLVSHNMLKKPDGTIPKPRPIIMSALEEFCLTKSNISLFDPTPHIIDFGINQAMKDPAHYNKEFEPIIGQAILNQLSAM